MDEGRKTAQTPLLHGQQLAQVQRVVESTETGKSRPEGKAGQTGSGKGEGATGTSRTTQGKRGRMGAERQGDGAVLGAAGTLCGHGNGRAPVEGKISA